LKQCRPQAIAGALQHSTISDAEDDDLEVAALAENLRQPVLQPLLEDGDQAGAETAPQTWPMPPTTAMNRYSMP
jgi:hypothetical protein